MLIDELSSGLKPTLASSIFAELRVSAPRPMSPSLMAEQNATNEPVPDSAMSEGPL